MPRGAKNLFVLKKQAKIGKKSVWQGNTTLSHLHKSTSQVTGFFLLRPSKNPIRRRIAHPSTPSIDPFPINRNTALALAALAAGHSINSPSSKRNYSNLYPQTSFFSPSHPAHENYHMKLPHGKSKERRGGGWEEKGGTGRSKMGTAKKLGMEPALSTHALSAKV